MKMIIDMPEEIYKSAQIIKPKYDDVIQIPLEVIANGTPFSEELEKIKEELNAQGLGRCDGKIFDKEYNGIIDKRIAELKGENE